MKYRDQGIVGLVVVAAMLGGMYGVLDSRIAGVENRQAYVFEIVRQRPVSTDFCKGLSDDRMTCAINAQRLCRCVFSPDQQDIEQKMMREEIARRLDEERIEKDRIAAEAQQQTTETEESSSED